MGIATRILELLNSICSKIYCPEFKSIIKPYSITFPFQIMGSENIKIGKNFVARKNLKLRAFREFNHQKFLPKLIIGDNVSIETDCHIGCINKIEIGDNVLIASGVYISDHMHGLPDFSDIETPPLER